MLPSREYIRSRTVLFDGALMLLKREVERDARNQGGMTRWLWADSSVQADRDLLQIKEMYVRNMDLVRVADAADLLALGNLGVIDTFLSDTAACNDTLQHGLRLHMRAPVAKASGQVFLARTLFCSLACNSQTQSLFTKLE